jgi:hypothetical protein
MNTAMLCFDVSCPNCGAINRHTINLDTKVSSKVIEGLFGDKSYRFFGGSPCDCGYLVSVSLMVVAEKERRK